MELNKCGCGGEAYITGGGPTKPGISCKSCDKNYETEFLFRVNGFDEDRLIKVWNLVVTTKKEEK